tara:strand:+ start:2943 stop:3092 length:150 start_codon:yes stop_codon:yes gene_type:complete
MNSSQILENNPPLSIDEIEILDENSFVLYPNLTNNINNIKIDQDGDLML